MKVHPAVMLISVVITVRNEERNIGNLLDGLIVQEKPFEIVIVDAHSSDGTVGIIKEYMKKYDFIRLYVRGGTRGEGRNYGVSKAKGDVVAFIDGDDIPNPFWLMEMRKSMEEGADIVAGRSIAIGYKAFEELERVELYYRGYDVTFPSCNLAYRKELFERIGGFNPYFVTAEDIDLNIRAVDAGGKIVHNPNAIVYHRTRNTFVGFFKQAFWNGYGRKQLTMTHGKLWGRYKPTNMLDHHFTFWYAARLSVALLGYMACKLYGEKPEK